MQVDGQVHLMDHMLGVIALLGSKIQALIVLLIQLIHVHLESNIMVVVQCNSHGTEIHLLYLYLIFFFYFF